jgi:hypothetical protein
MLGKLEVLPGDPPRSSLGTLLRRAVVARKNDAMTSSTGIVPAANLGGGGTGHCASACRVNAVLLITACLLTVWSAHLAVDEAITVVGSQSSRRSTWSWCTLPLQASCTHWQVDLGKPGSGFRRASD